MSDTSIAPRSKLSGLDIAQLFVGVGPVDAEIARDITRKTSEQHPLTSAASATGTTPRCEHVIGTWEGVDEAGVILDTPHDREIFTSFADEWFAFCPRCGIPINKPCQPRTYSIHTLGGTFRWQRNDGEFVSPVFRTLESAKEFQGPFLTDDEWREQVHASAPWNLPSALSNITPCQPR